MDNIDNYCFDENEDMEEEIKQICRRQINLIFLIIKKEDTEIMHNEFKNLFLKYGGKY